MNNRVLGNKGEQIAAEYLLENEYEILARNYKLKFAEIDIIAQKGTSVIFIEVKTRKSLDYGYPSQAVNVRKQRKIIHAAQAYIALLNDQHYDFRFDVIEVLWKKEDSYLVNHIMNGFEM